MNLNERTSGRFEIFFIAEEVLCRYFSMVRSNDLILQGSEILQSLQCPRLRVHFNFLWLERLIALEGPFWTQIRDVKKMSDSSKITHLDRYSIKCKVSMITILICPYESDLSGR